MLWLVPLVAFAASAALTHGLVPLLGHRGVMDVPNERSSHVRPTPRGGGIGIMVGLLSAWLVAILLGLTPARFDLLAATVVVSITGLIDDFAEGLSVSVRLAVQTAAAGLVVYNSGGIAVFPLPDPLQFSLGPLAAPFAMLWLVGVTNLYNFLDGIDGFAGLQGLIAAGAMFLLFPSSSVSPVMLAVVGATAGFLLHNWHPARIFMGDVGSAGLGFLLAALPLQTPVGDRPLAVYAMTFFLWAFLLDGAFTIFRRLSRGENVFKPHRTHLYQRLVQTGLSHSQVSARVMSAGVCVAAAAVVAVRSGEPRVQWVAVVFGLAMFSLYWWFTVIRERRSSAGPGHSLSTNAQLPTLSRE